MLLWQWMVFKYGEVVNTTSGSFITVDGAMPALLLRIFRARLSECISESRDKYRSWWIPKPKNSTMFWTSEPSTVLSGCCIISWAVKPWSLWNAVCHDILLYFNIHFFIRCNHSTKNFRLFFDGKHYVADKRFDTLHDLVEDGLITMFVEANAADYINAMMAEPIYDKHNKFSTVRENERNMSMERQDHLDFDQVRCYFKENEPFSAKSNSIRDVTVFW